MKKKIIGISCSVIGGLLISALLAFGIVQMNRQENIIETGNVLGVSWYNEAGAEFTITTAEQLREFAELSDFYTFRDQTIRLGADIVLNEGNAEDWKENAPKKRWVPISGFEGTFDGQGHTISGLYGKSFGSPMAMFLNTSFRCTIQDLKLVNSYLEVVGFSGGASFVSNGGGKLLKLYSDAIIECRGENIGGIASMVNVQSTFEECWYDGAIHITQRDCGGIVDEITEQRVSMRHCLFSGSIESEYTFAGTRTGGLVGRVDKSAVLNLEDNLVSGKITARKTIYTGALFGSTYAGTQIVVADSYVLADTYPLLIGESGSKGTFDGQALTMQGRELNGTNAYRWTTLDFDKYWAAQEGATPVLKYFAGEGLSLAGVEKAFDIGWYNSESYTYEITNLKQLYGLYILSAGKDFADKTVKLGADIVVNSGDARKWNKEEPENPWFPINTFAGTFDGQGHTISGIYVNTDSNYVGIFLRVSQTGAIRNLNLKNSYFNNYNETSAFMGSIVGETYGDLENIYSNAIIYSTGDQVGGIAGRSNDNDSDGKEDAVNIKNCWFDGELHMLSTGEVQEGAVDGGGIVGRLVQGDLNLEHCLNTGTLTTELSLTGIHLGGILGSTRSTGTLNITDTFNSGKIISDYTICVGSVIGRTTGGLDRIVNITDTYATTESYQIAVSTNASNATVNGGVVQLSEATLKGIGGYQWTTLDFGQYWAAVESGTPILKHYAGNKALGVAGAKKMVDFSWHTADAKEYILDSSEDLYGFSLLAAGNNFSGKTIKLGADITLDKSVPWIPVGSTSRAFAGTFDGQGHTISGMYLDTESQYSGFFAVTSPTSMLKNFKLVDSYFKYSGPALTEAGTEATAIIGSIAGDMRGDMENIYSNAVVESCANRAGGLVATANATKVNGEYSTATISNCWFDGKVMLTGESARYAGGIASVVMQGNVEFLHCYNSGSITNERPDAGQFLGGIFGTEWVANACNITISDCFNSGKVVPAYYNCVGSIVGRIGKAGSVVTLENVFATNESCKDTNGTVRTIWNKVADATQKGSVSAMAESDLLGVGGYRNTTLDFAKYWAARQQDSRPEVPALRMFMAEANRLSIAGVFRGDTSWYDSNKDAKEYHIKTAAELLGFAMIVNGGKDTFSGKTVYLDNDIQLNEIKDDTLNAWKTGIKAADNPWIPIGLTGTSGSMFAGTFDGQGNTISGVYVNATYETTSYIGLFGATLTGSTVKNFRLTDSFISYMGKNGFVGSVAGEIRGTLDTVYSNATVSSNYVQTGGLVGRLNGAKSGSAYTKAAVNNCWFNGEVNVTKQSGVTSNYAIGGIVGTPVQGYLKITDCLNSGTVSIDTADSKVYMGGIFGRDWAANCEFEIVDCFNSGEIKAVSGSGNLGAVIGNFNATSGDTIKTASCTIKDVWAINTGMKLDGKTGANMTAVGSKVILPEEAKGYNGYRLMNDKWVAVKDSIPVPKSFKDLIDSKLLLDTEGILTYDVSWWNTGSEYHIKTAEGFFGFEMLVNSGTNFSGKTVYLDNDIQLNEIKVGTLNAWKAKEETATNLWTPIGLTGTSGSMFAGTFDGQGNTISGVYVNATYETTSYIGLFGATLTGSTVKNFRLTDSFISYTGKNGFVGSVAGEIRGTLDTVYSNAAVSSNYVQTGGLVGRLNGAKSGSAYTKAAVNNCWFDGEVNVTKQSGVTSNYAIGGIVGTPVQGYLKITDCLNSGTVSIDTADGKVYMGGIFGKDWAANCEFEIVDCFNSGEIKAVSGSGNLGAVIGGFSATSGDIIKPASCTIKDVWAINTGMELEGLHGANATIFESKVILPEEAKGYDGYRLMSDKWVAVEDDTPVLESFKDLAKKKVLDTEGILTYDISWWNTGDNYQISTPEALYGFMKLFHEGNLFTGKTITLTKDVAINDANKDIVEKWAKGEEAPKNPWYPGGILGTDMFSGTFDGGGNTISGIWVDTDQPYVGLFGAIGKPGEVRNLRVTDSLFKYTGSKADGSDFAFAGSIAGVSYGTIDTVYSNATVVSNRGRVGGIVGLTTDNSDSHGKGNDAFVNKAWFDGELRMTSYYGMYGGGIVGMQMQRTVYITDCLFSGKITNDRTPKDDSDTSGTYVGGILGSENNKNSDIHIENCLSVGTIDTKWVSATASLVGGIKTSGAGCTIKNSYGTTECVASTRLIGWDVSGEYATEGSSLESIDAIKADAKGTLPNLKIDESDSAWVSRPGDVPALKAILEMMNK